MSASLVEVLDRVELLAESAYVCGFRDAVRCLLGAPVPPLGGPEWRRGFMAASRIAASADASEQWTQLLEAGGDWHRYGWRLWRVRPDGRLAPLRNGGLPADKPVVFARCFHGRVPPDPACPCGLHYMPENLRFFRWVFMGERWIGPLSEVAVSFGCAGGRVMRDRAADGVRDVSKVEAWALRATNYTILGIIPAEADSPHSEALAARYGVPVLTRGITLSAVTRLDHRPIFDQSRMIFGEDGTDD